jgi:hypothetical protein
VIKKGLVVWVGDDNIKTVIELLGRLQLTLVLGLAVTKDIEIAGEKISEEKVEDEEDKEDIRTP